MKNKRTLPIIIIGALAVIALAAFFFLRPKPDDTQTAVPPVPSSGNSDTGGGAPQGSPRGGGAPPGQLAGGQMADRGIGAPIPKKPAPHPRKDPFAGTSKSVNKNGKKPQIIVMRPPIHSRYDPFGRLQAEKNRYKLEILSVVGLPRPFVPGIPVAAPPTPVPYDVQPYRRLAGILSGDAIAAIMETYEGGQIRTDVIRPGSKVGEFRVAQLTSSFAVLKRSGNRMPKSVIVRLEAPPDGVITGIAGGGQGNPNGGQQGGPPPGYNGGGPPGGGRRKGGE